jgi:hypothetical protein
VLTAHKNGSRASPHFLTHSAVSSMLISVAGWMQSGNKGVDSVQTEQVVYQNKASKATLPRAITNKPRQILQLDNA